MGVDTAPVVVSSADDARMLLSTARASWLGLSRNVVLSVTGLTTGEQQRWERRLNFWGSACGCHAGLLFAVLASVRCAITFPEASGPFPNKFLSSLAFVIGAALIGKVAALAVARAMLALDLARLIRRLADAKVEAA
jgi:hypothetical protein